MDPVSDRDRDVRACGSLPPSISPGGQLNVICHPAARVSLCLARQRCRSARRDFRSRSGTCRKHIVKAQKCGICSHEMQARRRTCKRNLGRHIKSNNYNKYQTLTAPTNRAALAATRSDPPPSAPCRCPIVCRRSSYRTGARRPRSHPRGRPAASSPRRYGEARSPLPISGPAGATRPWDRHVPLLRASPREEIPKKKSLDGLQSPASCRAEKRSAFRHSFEDGLFHFKGHGTKPEPWTAAECAALFRPRYGRHSFGMCGFTSASGAWGSGGSLYRVGGTTKKP